MIGPVKIILLSLLLLAVAAVIVGPVIKHFKSKTNPSTMSMNGTTTMPTSSVSTNAVTNRTMSTAATTVSTMTNVTNAVSSSSTSPSTTISISANSTAASTSIASYYSSALTNTSASYCRIGSCSGALYYYEAIKINVVTPGNYSIQSNSSLDTYGYLYNYTFDPTYPSVNQLQYNDDGAGSSQFLLSQVLQTMIDYILVATTFPASVTGAFAIIVQGPAAVSMTPINVTASTPPTQSFYTSALTNNSLTFCRAGNCTGSMQYYQPIGFMTLTSGLYVIQSNSSLDTYGYIFNTTLHQIVNANGAVMSNDDGGGASQFLMTIYLQAMFNYTLVVTTYYPNVTGPFSVSATGNASVTFFAL